MRGAVYYARTDGSFIRRAAHPVLTPNGVGLSPDGRTLYVTRDRDQPLLVLSRHAVPGNSGTSPGRRPTAAAWCMASRAFSALIRWRSRRAATSAWPPWCAAASAFSRRPDELLGVPRGAGRLLHQHLLWRGGPADSLHHSLGPRATFCGAVASTGPAARGLSTRHDNRRGEVSMNIR